MTERTLRAPPLARSVRGFGWTVFGVHGVAWLEVGDPHHRARVREALVGAGGA